MKIRHFCSLLIALLLSSCASNKETKVGEIYKHDGDPCRFVPAQSRFSSDRKEFSGESWPEKARVHSWETAIADAKYNCHNAGYKDCIHLPAKDKKESTGKGEGPGKYYYQVTVVGKKVKEEARSEDEVKRDTCFALKECLSQRQKQKASREDILDVENKIAQKSCQ